MGCLHLSELMRKLGPKQDELFILQSDSYKPFQHLNNYKCDDLDLEPLLLPLSVLVYPLESKVWMQCFSLMFQHYKTMRLMRVKVRGLGLGDYNIIVIGFSSPNFLVRRKCQIPNDLKCAKSSRY